jgi:hypothetical protein
MDLDISDGYDIFSLSALAELPIFVAATEQRKMKATGSKNLKYEYQRERATRMLSNMPFVCPGC